MTYDHCPICGSYDFDPIDRDRNLRTTIYRCNDCGHEFEIEDDLFGYDDSSGGETPDEDA